MKRDTYTRENRFNPFYIPRLRIKIVRLTAEQKVIEIRSKMIFQRMEKASVARTFSFNKGD